MKKTTLLLIALLISQITLAQWSNLNSGIDDTLTDVVFFDNQGVVTGENGVYYTLTGGDGSANWQHFEITDDTAKAQLYANTEFTGSFSNPYSTQSDITFYFVGEDTVNNKAVLMSLELPTLTYNIISLDIPNSRLNDIKYGREFSRYYAVGTNGLFITFTNDIASHIIVNNTITDDYTALNFNSAGDLAQIGSYNKYFRLNTYTNALNEYSTPGEIHNDITAAAYTVNDKYMRHSFTSKYVYSEYDYGPINGNTIIESGGRNFVGTDHGIFISSTDKKVLQWQPSSGTLNINALWRKNSSATMYACGDNGLIMKNESANNDIEPYARIVFDGGCISNPSFEVSAVTGDTDSCAWYIDETLVSSDCESFDHPFTTVGIHTVRLVVTYNGITTQKIKTAHIVNDPLIDKPITIIDDILCHEEPIQIEISNSEPEVLYTLHKEGSNAIYGTSPEGNGGTIILTSIPVNETANFYLKSANIYARSCTKTFTDTFEIIVEQTEANFHIGLINAATDEDVTFFQTSTEASTFNWSFTTAANTLTSTLENATNSFNTLGIHEVSLTASSANLCVDDITLNSPNIYTAAANNTECWSYINYRDNPPWSGGYTPDISHMSDVTGGYLTGGNYRNEIFGTNHGIELITDEVQGGFLTKHDTEGTLKWSVYTIASNVSSVMASVEDLNGNIYIATNGNDSEFYDNSGKITTLNRGGSIIKLNANGELIWYMGINAYTPTGLTIDNNNDLIIYGYYDIYNDTSFHNVYFNDVLVDAVGAIIFPDSGAYRNCNGIIKATPEGSILWDNEIFSTAGTFGTPYHTEEIGVDTNNNYYVQGRYKNHMYIYHTGATESTDLDYLQYNPGGSTYPHVFKLDSDGALQWVTRSYSSINTNYGSVNVTDAKTDINGNTYITGYNNSYNPDFTFTIENADGTLFTSNDGKTCFVSKINSDGIAQWVIGAEEENEVTSAFPRNFLIDVKDDKINIVSRINTTIETPENLEFKSTDNNNLTVPLINTDLFISTYNTDGILNRVSVFNDVIGDLYNTRFVDIVTKNLNNYYFSSNIGSSSAADGKVNYLNPEFCANVYGEGLSLDDFASHTNVTLIPNPTNGVFKLSINKSYTKCTVVLYNALGQVLSNQEFTTNADIPLSIKGTSGMYFAEVTIDNTFRQTLKVIVK